MTEKQKTILNNITMKYMETKYYITREQLRFLDHYQNMFNNVAEDVKGLSSGENTDMQLGFELGKLHSTLRDQHLHMLSLTTTIGYQTIKDDK